MAFTLLASSLVNLGMRAGECDPPDGLDALRSSNYASALRRSIGRLLAKW